MATHLDLEEQEQLDELKHFWSRYGTAITAVLIVALLAVSGWNGYQYWERRQSTQASALYDEVERAAQAGDTALIERALADIKDRFGRTTYATQASMLAARAFSDKGNKDASRAALTWVTSNGSDEGYKALARLRIAGLLMDNKAWDEALQILSAGVPAEFAGLVADRKGDIYMAQGKRAEAAAEYLKAHAALSPSADYRALVAIKLNAAGVDPTQLKAPSAAASPETKK